MLKENSGKPPPNISSKQGTPVGSFRISTLSDRLAAFPVGWPPVGLAFLAMVLLRFGIQVASRNLRPCFLYQSNCEGLADEGHQQPDQLTDENCLSFSDFARRKFRTNVVQTLQRAIPFDLNRRQPADLAGRQRQCAGQE